ncbi:MAG: glycosyltransferase [Sulfurimonas sp.]|jgi:glycosyltransferase involved in cell wall biosynthesis
MNIFIIPSWYPTPKIPIGGIFVKEQAMAISELCPNDNVIVAKWNNDFCYLNVKKPHTIPKSISIYLFDSILDKQITDNFYEFYTPSLLWSKKLHFGGYGRLYTTIKKSFLRAKKQFEKIDIIHAHVSYPAGFIAYRLSKEFNIPYVITEHMGPFPFDNLLIDNKPIDEIYSAFNHAKRTIAVSNYLSDRIKSFGLPCSDVVPNFIDDNKFTPSINKKNKFTFFTLCGISTQKGIDTLLKAISLLDNELKDKIDFLIGGTGCELNKYKKMANKLALNNVIWLGEISRDGAPKLFQTSHAYIMLSRHETFGIVYAEAIATGIPIIATKCGGPEDIVNETNGILVAIDSPQEASNAIKYLYDNYLIYNQDKIRKDFENRFGKKIFVEKIMKIYKEVSSCAE